MTTEKSDCDPPNLNMQKCKLHATMRGKFFSEKLLSIFFYFRPFPTQSYNMALEDMDYCIRSSIDILKNIFFHDPL